MFVCFLNHGELIALIVMSQFLQDFSIICTESCVHLKTIVWRTLMFDLIIYWQWETAKDYATEITQIGSVWDWRTYTNWQSGIFLRIVCSCLAKMSSVILEQIFLILEEYQYTHTYVFLTAFVSQRQFYRSLIKYFKFNQRPSFLLANIQSPSGPRAIKTQVYIYSHPTCNP